MLRESRKPILIYLGFSAVLVALLHLYIASSMRIGNGNWAFVAGPSLWLVPYWDRLLGWVMYLSGSVLCVTLIIVALRTRFGIFLLGLAALVWVGFGGLCVYW